MNQEERIEYFMAEIARISNQVVDLQDERDAYLAELQKANAVIIDLQRSTPKLLEIHLCQVRADAGRKAHFDGYMLGYEHAMSNKEKCEPAVYAAEYHASALAGKELS